MNEEKASVELELENEETEATEATDTEASTAENELEQWKAQAEENHNKLLRAMADMENMRRRFRKEQEDLAKYASLRVIEELLPALDNFERALATDKETLTLDTLLQGVGMVYRQMVQVFDKEGLTPIEAAGKPFDPHMHQAVMQVEDSSLEPGIVVEELQKGYQFKDRVVRPAMVKVNA